MALAGGGEFTTTAPSDHLRSNAAVIKRFLPVDIAWERSTGDRWTVTLGA